MKKIFSLIALLGFLSVMGAGYAEAAPMLTGYAMLPLSIAVEHNGVLLSDFHEFGMTGRDVETFRLVVNNFHRDGWGAFLFVPLYDDEEPETPILTTPPPGSASSVYYYNGRDWPLSYFYAAAGPLPPVGSPPAEMRILIDSMTIRANNPPGEASVEAPAKWNYSWRPDAGVGLGINTDVTVMIVVHPGLPHSSGGCGNTGVGMLGALVLLLPVVWATKRRK